MFAAIAAYCRARYSSSSSSSSKALAQPKNVTAAAPSTAKRKKNSSESIDEKPSAKRRRSSRSAAARKVNYNEESTSDEEDIDELLEQYRPTKSIEFITNDKIKVKNNSEPIVSFTPLTGTNAADKSSLPGPGWTLGHWKKDAQKHSVWISPQRKMVFRKCAKAREFESIRLKYDGNEYKAWEEFRNQFRKYTSVLDPRKYDSA